MPTTTVARRSSASPLLGVHVPSLATEVGLVHFDRTLEQHTWPLVGERSKQPMSEMPSRLLRDVQVAVEFMLDTPF